MAHHVMLYGIEDGHLVLTTGPVSRIRDRGQQPRLVLRDALVHLSTRTQEGRRILTLSDINGFQTVGDDHYDDLRRVARVVETASAVPQTAPPRPPPAARENQ